MIAIPFLSLTMPAIKGKSRLASSGDKAGIRSFVEKIASIRRDAKLCGIGLRPVPGLVRYKHP
jgi:hypothetical protein